MKKYLVLLTVFLAACAQKPHFTYVQAEQEAVIQPTKPVPVHTPVYVPSLNKIPSFATSGETEKAASKPWEIIDSANADSKFQPTYDGYFNSIMEYQWVRGGLYQVYTAPLRTTDIQLEPGEALTSDPITGDAERWLFETVESTINGLKQTHIYVKPIKSGLKTNLHINTNKRSYTLELTSYKNTHMSTVSFAYSDNIFIRAQSSYQQELENAEHSIDLDIDLKNMNFEYEIDPSNKKLTFIPTSVFDDGKKTYFKFSKNIEHYDSPALFILSTSGKTELVNYRVKGNFYIADRLINYAELRLDDEFVHVSKKGFKLKTNIKPTKRRTTHKR